MTGQPRLSVAVYEMIECRIARWGRTERRPPRANQAREAVALQRSRARRQVSMPGR